MSPGTPELPRLRYVSAFEQISRDDLVKILVAVGLRSTGREQFAIGWVNGSRTTFETPEHLGEIQEPATVNSVSAFLSYADRSALHLIISRGEILMTADPMPEAIARKRYFEIVNLLETLRAPKARARRTNGSALALFPVGASIGLSLAPFLLGAKATWELVSAQLCLLLVGLLLQRIDRRAGTAERWIVLEYRERRPVNWNALGVTVGALTIVITVVAWLFPRT